MVVRRGRRLHFAPQLLVIGVALGLAELPGAFAHQGPPFPILMDSPAAGAVVSVWADPDIGEARFFIVVESPAGGPPRTTPRVSMWIEPVSGRLDRTNCLAKLQTIRNQVQFEANPYFDQRDVWNVGFRLTTSGGQIEELTTQVESTPPGFGPWDLAVYLFPFVFLGGMWLIAMARRRNMKWTQPETTASRSVESCRDQDLIKSGVEYRT